MGSVVYLAGNTNNDKRQTSSSSSYNDGVFVGQLNAVDGSVQWIQLVGVSSGTTGKQLNTRVEQNSISVARIKIRMKIIISSEV